VSLELNGVLVAVVALTGGVGATVRYLVQSRWPATGTRIPLGVLTVNAVGSLIAGAALGFAITDHAPTEVTALIISGFCGGLTTFSTFTVETVQLAQARAWRASLLNVGANLVLGVVLAFVSYGLCVTWLTSAT
jgi:CrcB protein